MSTQIANRSELSEARERALLYEARLEPARRKRMGQFFTGLPLSRLLAALSVRAHCSSVVDPMAGHGDLLDAVFERCSKNNYPLQRVDAIEIDPATANECSGRLQPWTISEQNITLTIHGGSAFEPHLIRALPAEGYDLVITNPPYVRYQTISNTNSKWTGTSAEDVRRALLQVVMDRVPYSERAIWRDLVRGYSGLSDLSVPAWLLASILVKPGGVLALVAPATWRNRDYADVLQYLLARCFRLEAVVVDRQPGWFSKVLVRTHLVVATRLDTHAVLMPVRLRKPLDHGIVWAEVDPSAKKGDSLVGRLFNGEDPEGRFTEWLLHEGFKPSLKIGGIVASEHPVDEITQFLRIRRTASWLKKLESLDNDVSPFRSIAVPHQLKQLLPQGVDLNLHDLTEVGIWVSQGLRTGCNGFFYVELIERVDDETVRVRFGSLLGSRMVTVPLDVLKPVLRRQSELHDFVRGLMLPGHVLDLRNYVLPEDLQEAQDVRDLYRAVGTELPKLMPVTLANLVRQAAETSHGLTKGKKHIPELSAVKTNARNGRSGLKPQPPRFWYMLPDFVRRHLPDAFVPRINQGTPYVLTNRRPPIIIDANFSTLWAGEEPWTAESIAGVLNSAWARACMEAVGTPMGGGALKLEATHLRRLPLPKLSRHEITRIAELVCQERPNASFTGEAQDEVDHVILKAILHDGSNQDERNCMIGGLCLTMDRMRQARQRG